MGFRPLKDFTDRVSKGMSPRKLFADDGFQSPVVDDGETDGTNLPKLAVGPHDALRNIKTGTFHQRSCGRRRPRYSEVWEPRWLNRDRKCGRVQQTNTQKSQKR